MESEQLKSEMLDLFVLVRGELDNLVNNLTADQKSERGSIQKWSAKDMLFHLAFWENHFNKTMEKGLKGEQVPQSGDYLNQVNDGVLFEHLDDPFDKARDEEKAAYQKSLEITQGIPADDMNDSRKYTFLNGRPLIDRSLGTFAYHTAFHISDYYLKAGQVDKARRLQEDMTERLCRFPTWKANSIYNLACFYALNGLEKEAIEKLKVAFKDRPELIEWSKQDSDMDPLREMPEFKALVG